MHGDYFFSVDQPCFLGIGANRRRLMYSVLDGDFLGPTSARSKLCSSHAQFGLLYSASVAEFPSVFISVGLF
jgi:hypothetical protein